MILWLAAKMKPSVAPVTQFNITIYYCIIYKIWRGGGLMKQLVMMVGVAGMRCLAGQTETGRSSF